MGEQFEGLSPDLIAEVHAGIQRLRGEVAIVIIEHHLDLVLALSDPALVLDSGSVFHVGPSARLRQDVELRRRAPLMQ
jgi:branched-chain amino acid transport system ATP-binding protein